MTGPTYFFIGTTIVYFVGYVYMCFRCRREEEGRDRLGSLLMGVSDRLLYWKKRAEDAEQRMDEFIKDDGEEWKKGN